MISVDLPGGSVVFSTREGGVSEGEFASLNCGYSSGDDVKRVEANRARALAAELVLAKVGPQRAVVEGVEVLHGADAPEGAASRQREGGERGEKQAVPKPVSHRWIAVQEMWTPTERVAAGSEMDQACASPA